MSSNSIKKLRAGNDLQIVATLTDRGLPVEWTAASCLIGRIYSVEQRVFVGDCDIEIDEEDATRLHICYSAKLNYNYLGENRLVLSFMYEDLIRSYDEAVIDFVALSVEADPDGNQPVSVSFAIARDAE